jgi:O-antigen/teichoic acid export membrane protein
VKRPSLRSLILQGSAFTFADVAGRAGLRLLGNIIVARLLFPEVFGLMALVHIFVQAMQFVTDIGIGPSIIHSRRSRDPVFLDTAWTMQVLRGGAIWLFLLLIAWPASLFYGEPQLLTLIPVVGFSAIITGFDSTARYTLNKELLLGRLTAMELGAQLAAVVVMIVWAYLYASVWALVAGAIVSCSVRMVWSHRLEVGRRDRFLWNGDAARELIRFGKWIFATSLLGFLASQMDRLILGKLIPIEGLGIYAIAFMLHQVPDTVLGTLGFRVMFPAVSQVAHLPREELREKLLRNRRPLLAGLAIGVALIAALGDVLVHAVYDDRYRTAGWMLQILALGLWPRMLANTTGPALLALGQPRYIAYASALRFAFVTVAVPLGHMQWGMFGVVAAVAIASHGDYVIESYGLRRQGLWLARQDLQLTAFWLALLAGMAALRHALGLPITEAPLPW